MRRPPSHHISSPSAHDERRRAWLVPRLVRAATVTWTPDSAALAEEAPPFDNDARSLVERRDPAASSPAGRCES